MTNLLQALNTELGRRASASTRRSYISVARKLVRQAGKSSDFTRQDLLGFIDSLNNGSPNSLNYQRLAYYALKRILKALGEPWPLDSRSDLPPLPPRMAMQRPSTEFKSLIAMIDHAKSVGGSWGQAYLVLSSVYGLRRVEMTTVDIKLPESKLIVKTAKHGEWREHLVPENLKPYLESYNPYSIATLSLIYNALASAAGVQRQVRENWHSVRRLLDTELIKAGPPHVSGPAWYLMVKHFMRWNLPSGDMAAYYFSAQDVDKEIFSVHPFLGRW